MIEENGYDVPNSEKNDGGAQAKLITEFSDRSAERNRLLTDLSGKGKFFACLSSDHSISQINLGAKPHRTEHAFPPYRIPSDSDSDVLGRLYDRPTRQFKWTSLRRFSLYHAIGSNNHYR